jgi:hypothetical protein
MICARRGMTCTTRNGEPAVDRSNLGPTDISNWLRSIAQTLLSRIARAVPGMLQTTGPRANALAPFLHALASMRNLEFAKNKKQTKSDKFVTDSGTLVEKDQSLLNNQRLLILFTFVQRFLPRRLLRRLLVSHVARVDETGGCHSIVELSQAC